MSEVSGSVQPISRVQKANELRSELLKMEGLGFPRVDIVKHLSEKYQVTQRAIHYHFQKRDRWQPQLQDFQHRALLVWNRNEQIYREAAFKFKTAHNENAQIGALRIMALVNHTQAELCGAGLENLGPRKIEVVAPWENKLNEDLKQYEDALESAARLNLESKKAQLLLEEQQDDSQ